MWICLCIWPSKTTNIPTQIVECIKINHYIIVRAARKRRQLKGGIFLSICYNSKYEKSRNEFRVDSSWNLNLLVVILVSRLIFK